MPRNSVLIFIGTLAFAPVHAENGHDGWLRYRPLNDPVARQLYDRLPAVVVAAGNSEVLNTARDELIRGVQGMLGRTLRIGSSVPSEPAIVIGTAAELKQLAPEAELPTSLAEEGYAIKAVGLRGQRALVIAGGDDRGALYGVFAVLRRMALHEAIDNINETEQPGEPIRWTNEWDNLDGTIERGYAGRSIFFEDGHVRARSRSRARLCASAGIGRHQRLRCQQRQREPSHHERRDAPAACQNRGGVSSVGHPHGHRRADSAVRKPSGGMDTFDPLDPRVANWWQQKADAIYRQIPDLAGLLVKADSEGQAGPSAYGRTQADAANVIARALKPHGGILVYRAFVYNHHMDWRDLKNDRARAAWDIFHPLDGKFDDNVVLQIKFGPIDFQVREPVSPLFGAMKHTSEALELEVTQEYTGQQRHLCYLAPMWKQVLDFDTYADGPGWAVKSVIAGRAFKRPLGGMVAVTNVGLDENWLGFDLAMANLYAFGRLAWNPSADVRAITSEWTRLTFGDDARVVNTIVNMQLASWPAYESYTGPLGIGTLTDILRGHYGPNPDSAERNGWGQWMRASAQGVGMDRTAASGTGYTTQYAPAVGREFESLEKCPDNLLLFFHHVPWTWVLHSGRTVIQSFYDSHYDGAAEAQQFARWWRALGGLVDEERFARVLDRLEYQAGHAIVWRDFVDNWAARVSGIPDARGRVGHEPRRVEAEAMQLRGYSVLDIQPAEAASGGKAVACAGEAACTATLRFDGEGGWYDIAVQYFDQANGISRYRLFVGDQPVAAWSADRQLPATEPNADSSTRYTARGVALRRGDTIRIEGTPDGAERAPVDYVEIRPAGAAQ